jgi:hypothetical protein
MGCNDLPSGIIVLPQRHIKLKNETMKTYETKDFPLAAFLITSGIPLQAHSRNGKVSTFTFSDSRQLQNLINQYYSFQASVNPIAYANTFRNLKSIMYSEIKTNDNLYHNTGATK